MVLTEKPMFALLDTKAAAAYLGLHPNTLEKRRVYGGSPKFCRLGRAVRYRPEDLDAWIAARVVESTSQQAR
jgi:predicted DNA-binding transcriptional regulator AlpA